MNVINILQLFLICFLGFCNNSIPSADSQPVKAKYSDPVPGAMQTSRYLPLLDGKAVACVVNHSSRIGNKHLVDSLLTLDIDVQIVFAPEHGFRGSADAGEHIPDGKDRDTGVTIVSLYGDSKKPSAQDLEGIQVVVFDIQDVGVRFYTYISTLHLVMEACAEQGISVVILDRPNPNGYYVDGPVLKPGYHSFVGMHEVPVVYGMSVGELAQMINGEQWLGRDLHCNLTVIPCNNYDHGMTYELPVAPSPNLPNHRAVLLYPSLCFFEGTHVSVGRGTDKQFQVIGHPRLDGDYKFTPETRPGATTPLHRGVDLTGIDLTSLDVDEIFSWKRLNLQWLLDLHKALDPSDDFFLQKSDFFDKLAGTDSLRIQLEGGWTEAQIRASWQRDLEAFKSLRKKYLIYPE